MNESSCLRFCGDEVKPAELELINSVIKSYPGLSRNELASTVCELLDWRRPSGALKARECREFLERLDAANLPEKRRTKPVGSRTSVPRTQRGEVGDPIDGALAEYGSPRLVRVKSPDDHALWRELIGRYHYQGYAVPFGAHLRYFVHLGQSSEPHLIGCLQFSSAAWRLKMRDQWIGWSDTQRGEYLQRIVNNSRFLILPWVNVKHLASSILGRAARQVKNDWHETFAVEPLLLETLVDTARFRGTSYLAANWIQLGETSGRGRMDKEHKRHGASPKTILIYPLVRNVRARLIKA